MRGQIVFRFLAVGLVLFLAGCSSPVETAAVERVADVVILDNPTEAAATSLVIPEGYDTALVTVTVSASALNRGQVNGLLVARSLVNGVEGADTRTIVAVGLTGAVTASQSIRLTSLVAGSEILIAAEVEGSSDVGEWANSSATVHVSASVIYS